jgi:hypothetical protein
MDLLQSYKGDSSSDDEEDLTQMEKADIETRALMPSVDLAPHVVVQRPIQHAAVVDSKTKELYYNPKYEELFLPEVYLFL